MADGDTRAARKISTRPQYSLSRLFAVLFAASILLAVVVQFPNFSILVVGTVFFQGVLRWRWIIAAIGGLCLVPIAITLSVAWTVAY